MPYRPTPKPTVTVAMPLSKALHILATVHTRDDDEIGFSIMIGGCSHSPWSPVSPREYIEAWRSVRAHIHFQTEPKP